MHSVLNGTVLFEGKELQPGPRSHFKFVKGVFLLFVPEPLNMLTARPEAKWRGCQNLFFMLTN